MKAMSDFRASSTGSGPLDPRKRVAYPRGMVLGAEDFEQEQFHLRARDHLGIRALHGYGTVSGLGVRWRDGQVEVTPGLAVDPEGRLVCVPVAQCADLGRWLAAHRDELGGSVPDDSPPAGVTLHVVLCHRECATDTVPLPSETCRSEADSMAASRILDSFELRLSLAAPRRAGEVATDALAEVLDGLLGALDSPPEAADLGAIQAALRSWATRDRPELPGNACLDGPTPNCAVDPNAPSSGILLARIDVDLTEDVNGDIVLDGPPVTDDSVRPVLLSSRFLQEWLTRLTLREPETAADDHNALRNLETGDAHLQYLPVDGSRPLTGDLDAGGHRLTDLAPSGPDGSAAMRRDQISGGDLQPGAGEGPLVVRRLQGTDLEVSGTDRPRAGQVLGFRGGAWRPVDLREAPAPTVGQVLPFVTIERMGTQSEIGGMFLLWFNLAAVDVTARLDDLDVGEQLVILSERCENERQVVDEIDPRRVVEFGRVECNLFRLVLESPEPDPLLRFLFRLEAMSVDGQPLPEYARAERITWEGQGHDETVTKFVLNPTLAQPIVGFEDIEMVVTPAGGATVVTR
jgi:hypothetical protein